MENKKNTVLEFGIYNIFKPYGWTSFDVVNKLKKIFKEKKIGHAGTLDPMATGVLVVAVGREYTKKLQELTGLDKCYLAEIMLGVETDSYDLEGNIVQMKQPGTIEEEAVIEVLKNFKGEIKQNPPVYSAIKKNGRKLYEYARKNQEVEIEERTVQISSMKLLSYKNGFFPKLIIKTVVSKGTYIRSLAHDIGVMLNTGAVLSRLTRLAVGPYYVQESRQLNEFF
ncbi:MAG: tRNA pseudouridine(55) synthase TruB [Candidatus Margulisbacteria bacterium]|nr:tRNA pseudouridine(55) synthase TruB [Candidatus Margulisiibacteriota bacterium]